MTQGYIQVPPDITGGKRVDATELLNENQVTVERQRVEIPDGVEAKGDLLTQMLIEQRVQNIILQQGLQVQDDIDALRNDLSDIAGFTIPTVREILTENRNYYVSKTGSDNNDGLTSSAAFLTIQHAADVITKTLDIAGFTITVNIGDGTYIEDVKAQDMLSGVVVFVGNSTTPSNVVIQGVSAQATFWVTNCAYVALQYVKLTSSAGACFLSDSGLIAEFDGIVFGTAATYHVWVFESTCYNFIDYSITGSASQHTSVNTGGNLSVQCATVTVTGTPAFATAFMLANGGGQVFFSSAITTISGGATGKRYSVTQNAVVDTQGGGANYFPGDVAGTTATGGQYI